MTIYITGIQHRDNTNNETRRVNKKKQSKAWTYVALFLQGADVHSSMSTWQLTPVYPGAHKQVYIWRPSIQVDSCAHGTLKHSFIIKHELALPVVELPGSKNNKESLNIHTLKIIFFFKKSIVLFLTIVTNHSSQACTDRWTSWGRLCRRHRSRRRQLRDSH